MRALYRVLTVPAVYRAWSGLVSPRDGRRAFADDYVRANAGDRVLDIGCGPADIFPWLGAVEYTGFDANPEYVAAATARYGDRATFRCQRVSEEVLAEEPSFDIVLAQGILHHLDDTEAAHLFDVAHRALRPGGRLVTLDPAFAEGQSPIARYVVGRDRGEHVRHFQAYVDLASRRFPETRAEVRHDLLRIPYTHAILTCTKRP